MTCICAVIYDKVAQQFTAPLCFNNEATAQRYFNRTVAQQGEISDFKMYKIGDYNDETGVLVTTERSVIIDGESYGKNE